MPSYKYSRVGFPAPWDPGSTKCISCQVALAADSGRLEEALRDARLQPEGGDLPVGSEKVG